MKAIRDPERNELAHVVAACALAGQDVLEIGCGDGKFTCQYSDTVRSVVGIDVNHLDLETASTYGPCSSVHFIQGSAEHLPVCGGIFDIAIFASSL